MYLVVSYDITSDRRRARVARLLEDYGTRVQYSVFECLLNERALLQLQRLLQEEIDMTVDSIRFYRLCSRCRTAIDILGRGSTLPQDQVRII